MSRAVAIDVYIPSAPCPCGGGLRDKRAERFERLLVELRDASAFDLRIAVYALNTQFHAFKNNPVMAGILQEEGHNGLPVVCLDGRPAFKGRFPDREELTAALDALNQERG